MNDVLTLAELERFDPCAPARATRRRFLCPLSGCSEKRHDATHRSLTVEVASGLWKCHRCGTSGQLRENWDATPRVRLTPRQRANVERAAGVNHRALTVTPVLAVPTGTVPTQEPPSKAIRRQLKASRLRQYEIRDTTGTLRAVHVRQDKPDGGKRIWWELPDGTHGLGGMSTTGLPLYGAHELPPSGAVVVLTEGEPSRDALHYLDTPAVATVCGASAVMSDTSLGALSGYRVVLWPDNDEPGHVHMQQIGSALLRLGIAVHGVVRWDKYPGGDAGDFVLDHRDPVTGTIDRGAARAAIDALTMTVEPVKAPDMDGSDTEQQALLADVLATFPGSIITKTKGN